MTAPHPFRERNHDRAELRLKALRRRFTLVSQTWRRRQYVAELHAGAVVFAAVFCLVLLLVWLFDAVS